MGTSLRKNDIVQITIPWHLHTSVLKVFTNFSDHGRLSYEGFKTILAAAINSYKISPSHLYNLFNQIKEEKDYLDFEQFLLALDKLSQHVDKNSDKTFNDLLNKVAGFYKNLPNSEHHDFSDLKYNNINNPHLVNLINKPTPRHSRDLVTNYQPINIGVKYNTCTIEAGKGRFTSSDTKKDVVHPEEQESTLKRKEEGLNDLSDFNGQVEGSPMPKGPGVDVATSARSIDRFEDKFTDKLNKLDSLFNNTQLLKLDFDKVTESYKSLKSSEKEWEKTTQKLEEEKTSLRDMIDSLIADKKSLADKIENLKKEIAEAKSELERKNNEIENLKHSNSNLVSLEKELCLESYEETSLFLVFTYYRKLDHNSGNWVIDEDSLVNFVYDYGLVEEHCEGEDKMLRAKLAFDKCVSNKLVYDETKNLTLLSFKFFLAEYGKMAFKEDDANKALKLVIERVIAENNSNNIHNDGYDYSQVEYSNDDSIHATSMAVEGNLWFQ